ncbi:TPA: hypothetical protein O5T86_001309 [Staphylococcus aureus]|nr:hypothetical protein [Staphylococcus aureus]HDA7217695.1 hypothetical protein [Staphylococcus aureus]HDA7235041.1 hypothetical protein [Staphylococcus aureus]HDA7236847.1 hypothetical protein [Staphylococcus aureus]HDA7239272.1 hypothetical protein [Staphylococcus aureus]
MIGTGLAILGAGILGAGASMYGANKAASVQGDAARQAAALQQQQMAENKANFDPFIKSGQGASNLLQSFYGLNGDQALGQSALERFYQSPDYTFALKGGSDALDNSAAAKGGVLGGNQIRAQTEYGAGLATQNLGGYLGRLQAMSGQGIQAASGVAGPNTVGAKFAGDATMGAGTADASGILGMTKGFNSGLNSLSLYNQMGKSSYAPSPNYLASYNGNQIGGLY